MSRKTQNIVGLKCGLLTIKEEIPSFNKHGHRCVTAICECGAEKAYLLNRLISGHTKSCGKHKLKRGNITHGLSNHPLYKVWENMKTRCFNSNYHEYHNYGGRGVTVCQEWVSDFKSFYDWSINNGWRNGLDIDKDIKGNGLLYSPETCCFVTEKVNNNHTRDNKYLTYKDETLSMSQMAEKFGVNYYLLRKRLSMGWEIKDAIEKPSRKLKSQVAA